MNGHFLLLLKSEMFKFLKNLHGVLYMLMGQIIKNILNNIFTKGFIQYYFCSLKIKDKTQSGYFKKR